MKRALVITYYWPPTGGSGVQRWLKFAELLPKFGWEPVIYTPENPEQLVVDESLLDEIPAGTEIIKTHITEPYGIYRKFTGGKGIAKEVNIVSASADKSPVQRLSMFVRGNFFVPDPRCLWIRPSVRFLKKYIKEHPVDVIISTGPPNSMHLIGRNLKRETGLPWIADFRDPWTEIFYFKHIPMCGYVRKKHLRLEKNVLDEADTVVAVSPIVQQDFMKKTSTPVELITNGWDRKDFPEDRKADFHRTFCSGRKPGEPMENPGRPVPGRQRIFTETAHQARRKNGQSDYRVNTDCRPAGRQPWVRTAQNGQL